jgi:hypothetical protein
MANQGAFKYFVKSSKHSGSISENMELYFYKSDAIFNFIFHKLKDVFRVYMDSGEFIYKKKLFLHKVSTMENNDRANVMEELTLDQIKNGLDSGKKYEQENTTKLKNNEQEKKREFIFNIFTKEA